VNGYLHNSPMWYKYCILLMVWLRVQLYRLCHHQNQSYLRHYF
jgi:hypothetical protein